MRGDYIHPIDDGSISWRIVYDPMIQILKRLSKIGRNATMSYPLTIAPW